MKRLACDNCYNYVPVNIYSEEDMFKCERCSNDASAQVARHEEACECKRYVCPICQDKEAIPTFLTIKRYQLKHSESFIQRPIFRIDLNKLQRTEGRFFYKQENKLFFINCSSRESEGTVILNVSLLGYPKKSEKITQQFFLYCETTEIQTGKKPCLPYNESDTEGFAVDTTTIDKTEMIIVCLFIDVCRILLPEEHVANMRKENASLIQLGYSESDLLKPRAIFLNAQVRLLRVLSAGPTPFICCLYNKKETQLNIQCCICGEVNVNYLVNHVSNNYVSKIETKEGVSLICNDCYKYFVFLDPQKIFKITDFMILNTFNEINFFCIWNCGGYFPIKSIVEHEVSCDKQPTRSCPLESCTMRGMSSEIQTHFTEHSPEHSLALSSIACVDLNISKSPIRQFLTFRNVFVFIEISWIEYLWHMKFKLCGEKDTFAGMKLKAMIFDPLVGDDFLKVAESNDGMKFCHMEQVKIKCFLHKQAK